MAYYSMPPLPEFPKSVDPHSIAGVSLEERAKKRKRQATDATESEQEEGPLSPLHDSDIATDSDEEEEARTKKTRTDAGSSKAGRGAAVSDSSSDDGEEWPDASQAPATRLVGKGAGARRTAEAAPVAASTGDAQPVGSPLVVAPLQARPMPDPAPKKTTRGEFAPRPRRGSR